MLKKKADMTTIRLHSQPNLATRLVSGPAEEAFYGKARGPKKPKSPRSPRRPKSPGRGGKKKKKAKPQMMCGAGGGSVGYMFRGAARTEFDATFRSASKSVEKSGFNAKAAAAKKNIKKFFNDGLASLKDVKMPSAKKVAAVSAAAALAFGAYKAHQHKDELATEMRKGADYFMSLFAENPKSNESASQILDDPEAQAKLDAMQNELDKAGSVAKDVAETLNDAKEDLGQCFDEAGVTTMEENPTEVFEQMLKMKPSEDDSGVGEMAERVSGEVPEKEASGVVAATLGLLGVLAKGAAVTGALATAGSGLAAGARKIRTKNLRTVKAGFQSLNDRNRQNAQEHSRSKIQPYFRRPTDTYNRRFTSL